jgi:hypothetical protein
MNEKKKDICPHCGMEMKKWRTPENSTWGTEFQWVCFNDECSYFVKGWDHMMESQNVKASYRHRVNPDTGAAGPLPCWSYDAHKDKIIENEG